MIHAYLGLGSNLGDRLATLQRAVDLLAENGVTATASARVWQSEPVGGPPGQDDYLNAVIRVETVQSARELLRTAQGVETALGRTRDVRWGPRTVDIDILIIDGVTNDTPELVVPHPRMLERAFVLLPLLELVRDPWLPDGRSVLTTAQPIGVAWPLAPPLLIPA